MYLAGDPVPAIAGHYGVSDRDIYYHLGTLSAEDKGKHAMNSSHKMTLRKKKRKEDYDKESGINESTTSLDDFNQ